MKRVPVFLWLAVLLAVWVRADDTAVVSKDSVKDGKSKSSYLLFAGIAVLSLGSGAAYIYTTRTTTADPNLAGIYDGDVEADGSISEIRVAQNQVPLQASPDFKTRFKQYVDDARERIMARQRSPSPVREPKGSLYDAPGGEATGTFTDQAEEKLELRSGKKGGKKRKNRSKTK